MKGALIDLFRSRELLWVLVYRDIRGRTRASVLGHAWIVLPPLLATGLYALLIQGVLHVRPSGSIPYVLFVFAGMSVWSYFSGGLSAATDSLVGHSELLRQVKFPREVLVLYPLIGRLIDFTTSFVVLGILATLLGVPLTPGFFVAPIILVPVLVFAFGLALILSPLNVALRDVGKAVPLLLTFAIFATPVLYPLERVPEAWRALYLLNPMAGFIHSFRGFALEGTLPDPSILAMASLVAVLVWMAGQWLFARFELSLGDVV